MKKLIFTSILSTGFIIALSQNYTPLIRENTYWDVHHGNNQLICDVERGNRYFFQGDSVINSIQYKVIRSYPIVQALGGPYCPPFMINYGVPSSIDAFMREDTSAKKVYIYDQLTQSDQLLFDFSLNQGDTLNSVGLVFVIDTIKTITLHNGQTRKLWNAGNEFYIEGIGGSQGLFFKLTPGFGINWQDPFCITENNITIWGLGCTTFLGNKKLDSPNKIKVFPTPAHDFLYVERESSKPVLFTIHDLYGKIVLAKKLYSFLDEINISYLPKGLYLYSIENKKMGKILAK